MLQYLKNIIPRIQRYSKSLDKEEVFVDKPWVLQDERNNIHEYMFLRDNRLILSVNGIAKEGRWELLPNGKLLINRVDDQILLQNMFIDDAIMILKLSGTTDIPFTLINEQKIPDKDIEKYLVDTEKRLASPEQLIESANKNLLQDVRVSGSLFKIGERIDGQQTNEIISGTYLTTKPGNNQYVVVENGIIEKVFYKVPYFWDNKKVEVIQKNEQAPTKNDFIVDFNITPAVILRNITLTNGNKNFMVRINNKGVIVNPDR